MTERDDYERRELRDLLDEFHRSADERFSPEERKRLRDFLRMIESEEDQRRFRELLAVVPDIRSIVEGKRVSAGVYKAVGGFAKWAGGIIAAIIAYKTLFYGGK